MPDTTLTSAELDELEALAKAATPGDLDTVNDPPDEYGGKSATGWYECPCCESVGEVEGVTYSNFDAVAMGVQFFGIGNEHKNYEAFFRAANPATILRLLSLARAGLEASTAEESMRERAAELADSEAALRKENGVAAEAGDTRWGLDTEAASLAQYHKSVTASLLAVGGDKP